MNLIKKNIHENSKLEILFVPITSINFVRVINNSNIRSDQLENLENLQVKVIRGPAGPEGRLPFSPPPPATTTTTTVLLPPPPPPSSPPPSTPPPAAHLSRGGTKDSIEFERKFPCNVERGRDHLRTDHKRGTTFLD
ncbi:hypothetical protein V1477_012313 [Vespula maculifrons]|uniref:Uncharacterized protein n=1 Tax=Vespula maculifrons TaxID=7453 RepID=A0ABD2BX52_VESMC